MITFLHSYIVAFLLDVSLGQAFHPVVHSHPRLLGLPLEIHRLDLKKKQRQKDEDDDDDADGDLVGKHQPQALVQLQFPLEVEFVCVLRYRLSQGAINPKQE